jgi:hypothetical protein
MLSKCPAAMLRPPFPTLGVDAGVIEPLGKVAKAIGHLNVIPDVDGGDSHRAAGAFLLRPAFPSLSLLVAARSHNLTVADIQVKAGRLGEAGQAQDRHRCRSRGC